MAEREPIKITKIDPTIFYYQEEDRILQVAHITIENFQTEKAYDIVVRAENVDFHQTIDKVAIGAHTHQIGVPDIQQPGDIIFEIASKGKVYSSKTLKWIPQRHWEVHLVQFAHHDLGYTDLPQNVLDDYLTFIDDVIQFCDDTKDLPAEAQFRYTIETTWSILHYLKNRCQDDIERLMHFIKEGRIEVCALLGNQITELAGSEELIRSLASAFALKKRYGIPIRSAMLNDIPGFNWGLASLLTEAGIRYFSPALPQYFSWEGIDVHGFWDEKAVMPNGAPDAFYWEAQTGKRLLVWQGDTGATGIADPELPDLEQRLKAYQSQGYPYRTVRCLINGAMRDNAPPNRAFCDTVKAWNEKWVSPKLLISTNTLFFEQFEKELPESLRTFRGDLPGTDYPVAATSVAQELAVNRQTQHQLPDAEKFATIAATLTDYQYATKALEDAYFALAMFDERTFGQFHPIGPAQQAELAEKKAYAYRAAATAHSITQMSLNRIADHIALPEDAFYLIVFNALPFDRTDVVAAEFSPSPPAGMPLYPLATASTRENRHQPPPLIGAPVMGRQLAKPPLELLQKGFQLIDTEKNASVPYQIKEISTPNDPVPYAPERYAFGQKDHLHSKELIFVAHDIPALGYKCYCLKSSPKKPTPPHALDQSGRSIENKFYKIVIALNSGGLFSIYDKELGCELVDGFAKYRINQLFARCAQTQRINILENIVIRKEQRGSVGISLVITGHMEGCPLCVQEIMLYNEIKRIDFTNRIIKDSTPLQEIYFAFPFQVKAPVFHYESALNVIEPLKDAFPGAHSDANAVQSWIGIANDEIGITWASQDAPIVRIGDLWQGYVSQAHHLFPPHDFGRAFATSEDLTKAHLYSLVMTGNYKTNFGCVQLADMLFRYSVTSHKGNWKNGNSQQFGWSHASKLSSVFMKGQRKAALPLNSSFCQIEPNHVKMLSMKRAEAGDDIILRFLETQGSETEVMFSLNFARIESAFKTDLEENNVEEVIADEHSVIFNIMPNQIATLRLQISGSKLTLV
ncbi:hypothetical protein JXJ21_11460 [candidate division KSB1 bacterium]|nr:hypothetical protein [candidate division KSB1 bacterium]